ncbi:hypothetical protein ACHAWF_006291, partial [Thalassiosira exigua]
RLREKGMKVGGKKAELVSRLCGKETKNAPNDNQSEEYFKSLTVAALKEELRKRGLRIGGNKHDLIERLMGRDVKVVAWKNSHARLLLNKLFRDDKSFVHRMTAEEIHASNPLFKNYPLPKFKDYLKGIKEVAAKESEIVKMNEKEIWQDELAFPRKEMTCRGYPFWDTHPARALLEEDIKSGNTEKEEPKKVWESRAEYMQFPLHVFRGHIYQEMRRQRERPGWVVKRNKKALKMHEKEVNALKTVWDVKQQDLEEDELQKMCEQWELLHINED